MLVTASTLQFSLHELPCPLCLLQRIGITSITIGLLLNLFVGLRPSHYAWSLFGALFTAAVALRQILLHIVPGTGSYGGPVFGLHLYTWVFIISATMIVFNAFMLLFDSQFKSTETAQRSSIATVLIYALGILVIALTLMNAASTYLECGFSQCADNPVVYKILQN